MGAAIGHVGEDAVGIGGEAPVGEEHRFDPLPELLVGEKQQAVAPYGARARPVRHGFRASCRRVCRDYMSALLTFQERSRIESQVLRNKMSGPVISAQFMQTPREGRTPWLGNASTRTGSDP